MARFPWQPGAGLGIGGCARAIPPRPLWFTPSSSPVVAPAPLAAAGKAAVQQGRIPRRKTSVSGGKFYWLNVFFELGVPVVAVHRVPWLALSPVGLSNHCLSALVCVSMLVFLPAI